MKQNNSTNLLSWNLYCNLKNFSWKEFWVLELKGNWMWPENSSKLDVGDEKAKTLARPRMDIEVTIAKKKRGLRN